MHRIFTRPAGLIVLAAVASGVGNGIGPASALEPAAPAYVNQLDNTGFSAQPQLGTDGSVYVNQLSPDARPALRKKKSVASREKNLNKPNEKAVPDVGAGVSLALSPTARDAELPNVGRGVVR